MIDKVEIPRRAVVLGLMLSMVILATMPLAACGREGDNDPPTDVDPQAEKLRKGRDIHGHR